MMCVDCLKREYYEELRKRSQPKSKKNMIHEDLEEVDEDEEEDEE
jgi:hypothetical protein